MKEQETIYNKNSFRPDEVAVMLRISRRTIYRMIRDGRLPANKLGKSPWRVQKQTLVNIIGDF